MVYFQKNYEKKDCMQHMKKIKVCFLYICLISAIPFIHAQEAPGALTTENDPFDDPFVNSFLDEHQNEGIIFRQTPSENAQAIINSLIAINGINILKENLICRTNPLNKRNILDYPFILQEKLCYAFDWTLGFDFFYNQTSRAFFTQNCDNISGTFAFKSQSLIDALTQSISVIQQIIPKFTVDPFKVLPLFENGTAQDRRLGFIFKGLREFRWVNFRFMLPLYYNERNFYFTDEERQLLEAQLGALSPDQQSCFQKQHLISDQLGIGDTRLMVDFNLKECDDFAIRGGFYVTLPTAVAFVSGIAGSKFDKCAPRPIFSFEQLFACANDATPEEIKQCSTQIIQTFLTQALDHFSANILQTNLGYEGHIGLGAWLNTRHVLDMIIHRKWASNLTWLNNFFIEYLCPGDEKRFFILPVNQQDFDSRNFEDQSQAIDNLAFLDMELVNRVIPYTFTTNVHPGFVLEWTSKFQYEADRWGFNIGADFWLQGKEKFTDIHGPNTLVSKVIIPNAQLPLAYQGKILGGILYKMERETRDWMLAFFADYTFASSGIGKDFTLGFNLDANF